MDLKDLRYFVAVYEAKGFSSASLLLGTVQSNVSIRIRSLEDFIGAPLFERRYRSIVPTQVAETLYEHAKNVLASLDLAREAVKTRYQ